MRLLKIIFIACALMWSSAASAQDRVSYLMLDTGGHMASQKALAFTPDGTQLVSAAEDKVIRVWDWQAGKTVRTFRGQAGLGNEGKVFTMALSPDGRWLAAAGWMRVAQERVHSIRIYDFGTGQLVALLREHTSVVHALAFAPDSKHLVSGGSLGDLGAIIWDVENRKMVHRLQGHKRPIYAVAFTPDGTRVVTGSEDATLRLWRVSDGGLIAEMKGHTKNINRGLAVRSTDSMIASGDATGEIRLWDGHTGEFLRTLVNQGGAVGPLKFSPDGKALLATCSDNSCKLTHRVWEVDTGKELVAYKHDIAFAAALSPDGRLVATGGGGNHDAHVWDLKTGETKQVLSGTGRPVWGAAFSSDGLRIAWGNVWRRPVAEAANPLEFELRLPGAGVSLGRPERLSQTDGDGFFRGRREAGTYTLVHRAGGDYSYNAILDVTKDGQTVASIERNSSSGFEHRAYFLSPDGQTIISGGNNGWLSAHDLRGRSLGNFVGHEGDIWAAAPSPDGKYLISGSGDQTIRIWNLKTRDLLVTLFRGTDDEWVMWTPEGFFTGSENGSKLVGWHINQGHEKEARFVTGDQLRRTFFRPDLVAEKLAGDPKGRVREETARLKVEEVLASGVAPEVIIVEPRDGGDISDASVLVTVKVTDKGGGIGRLTWRVNDQVKATTLGGLSETGEISRRFDLASIDNVIEVSAENKRGFVQSLAAKVTVKVDEKALKGAPNLYILAIGVDQYKEVKRKLEYAVADAKNVSAALANAGKDFYRTEPKVLLLRDDEVTANRLDKIFDELGEQIKATDVFVLFIAGHGKTVGGDYYFVPRDIGQFTDEGIRAKAFGPKHWTTWFAKIKAEKSIWIIDTCESGSAGKIFRGGNDYDAAYKRLKDATGRTIFMSASEQQLAIEGYRGHGVFSYAFMEGLARADQNNPKEITLLGLMTYVDHRVPEISREMKACEIKRADDYCQRPTFELGKYNYPLVPRYPDILDILAASGAVVLSKIPTHIVLPPGAELFAQAARGAGRERQLDEGESVTLVTTKEGWAQVAQGGKIIGFVQQDRLLKLKK
jgi:WD40 repeat protein